MLLLLWLYIGGFCVLESYAARILGIGWYPAISHQATFQPIWRELSLRGHQVTAISAVPLRDKRLTNLTEIDISFLSDIVLKRDVAKNLLKDNWTWKKVLFFKHLCIDLVELMLKHDEVIDLIKSDQRFDVIIVEPHSPLVFAFGERFKAPIIGKLLAY